MKRIGLGLLAVFTLVACQRDDKALNQKLDQINSRLMAIEARLGNSPAVGQAGAAAARPPQQARATPDPSAVYAVPVGESATIGSKLAKVTIVEAFTFT